MKKKVPLYKLFPSVITILALCMGMTAIKYTFEGNLEMAVVMVLIACFMDGVDGSAARLLKSSSDFGAQLDSLADLVSFGVTPAIIIYHWKLSTLNVFGWVITLIYASCTALRLARYNVESAGFSSDVSNKIKKNKYFEGISSPCAAILALTPLIATFQILSKNSFHMIIICIYMLFISLMMVSRIPTISTRAFKIEKHNVTFIMAILAICTSAIFLMPWIIIPIFALIYLISIPFSWFHYTKKPALQNIVDETKD
jgi:CDP-diacylglycerol--serine O-phosphatidyltransferase